jgi:precorrin-2/cobalt-factor-2 C20-methyltransferase
MAGETVMRLADKTDDAAPYFSMVLVPGEGRRP